MHLEKCTITMWKISTVSPSNYQKFLGLFPTGLIPSTTPSFVEYILQVL